MRNVEVFPVLKQVLHGFLGILFIALRLDSIELRPQHKVLRRKAGLWRSCIASTLRAFLHNHT